MQWLPYKWYFQLIYVAYRWLITFYFFGWLVYSGVFWDSPTYFIFLTNWCFLAFNTYLIIAALSVTTKLISVHFVCKPEGESISRKYEVRFEAPKGCCGYLDNNLSWYQVVHWVSYLLGNELAVIVCLLYWILLYDSEMPLDGVNVNTHLVNGIIALADLWICGIPIYTLHVVHVMLFAAVYVIFTGIYFGASTGRRYVYNVLDYDNNTGLAVALAFLSVFVIVPVIHFVVIYPLSKLKEYILYRLFKGQETADTRRPSEDNDYNLTEVPKNN